MKTAFALLALSVSTAASSACYSIYTSANELVWQGTSSPVPMNTLSINDEVRKKVPDGHMVVANNAGALCFAVDVTTRDTMRQRAEKIKYD
jgi:isocitrate lyase